MSENMFETVSENTKSLAERSADQIQQLIVEKRLVAGEKLPNEFELAERLKVGRGTIREAVKVLVSRHVLEIHRGKGTFVSQEPGQVDDPLGLIFYPDKQKLLRDLMETRLIIEPQIASLAAQRADSNDIARLTFLCAEIDRLAANNKNYVEVDAQFHTAIAQSTRNEVITNLLPIIVNGIHMYNRLPQELKRRSAIKIHRDIVQAIANKDPEQASASMISHLITSQRIQEEILIDHQ